MSDGASTGDPPASKAGPGGPAEPKPRRSRAAAQAEKRAKILAAASEVFNRLGYDGASMNDIAAEAKVSKPTLYVYFTNKESLFAALIEDMVGSSPELALVLDAADPDVAGVLTRYGVNLMKRIAQPASIALYRLVIGAASKFPEVGRMTFAAGPERAATRLAEYLAAQNQTGRLRVPDVELAAYQLLDLMQTRHLRRLAFNVAGTPTISEIEGSVASGVGLFLAGYGDGLRRT